jgi:hypothetical protein
MAILRPDPAECTAAILAGAERRSGIETPYSREARSTGGYLPRSLESLALNPPLFPVHRQQLNQAKSPIEFIL